jgi:hypothetical protein
MRNSVSAVTWTVTDVPSRVVIVMVSAVLAVTVPATRSPATWTLVARSALSPVASPWMRATMPFSRSARVPSAAPNW